AATHCLISLLRPTSPPALPSPPPTSRLRRLPDPPHPPCVHPSRVPSLTLHAAPRCATRSGWLRRRPPNPMTVKHSPRSPGTAELSHPARSGARSHQSPPATLPHG
uniref:Uncharacterized protein n=1 Tax=Triticum urartu TaxID=4572 RepID=A0A8R7VIL2_TRIUA